MIRLNIVVSNPSWRPKTCWGLNPEQWLPKLEFLVIKITRTLCDTVKLDLQKKRLSEIGFANERRFVNSIEEGLSVYY